MSLQKHVYSVLIVSSADSFNTTISNFLPESKYSPIEIVTSISAAKRKFSEKQYDFVIINCPLPDDYGARFAIDVSNSNTSVSLLLVKTEIYDDIYDRVNDYGVFTLQKPANRYSLETVLSAMCTMRAKLKKLVKSTTSIEQKMEEIRLVNRAKWMLINELSISEPEAHRFIEKQAMNRCVSKKEIADEIIKTYS